MSIHVNRGKFGNTYRVKLRDPDGKQFTKTFKTRREAEAWQVEQKQKLGKNAWSDPKSGQMTVRELAAQWCEITFPNKRQRTRERDASILDRHILPHIGDRTIASIKPLDVDRLINKWTQSGHKQGTVLRERAIVSGLFTYAVKNDYLTKNPVSATSVKKVPKAEPQVITVADFEKILDELTPTDQTILMVMFGCGLRWSEMVGLRVKDLDLTSDPQTLSVEQSVHITTEGVLTQPPKSSAGRRKHELPKNVADTLTEYLEISGIEDHQSDRLLFTAPGGGVLRYSNWVKRHLDMAFSRAGVARVTTKALRSSYSSYLADNGIPLKTIQKNMGHADSRTTMNHYIGPTDGAKARAADVIDGLLPRPKFLAD
ncbi:MAG: tyrosine-type recombinase/integrase [Actinomycetota bacterium]